MPSRVLWGAGALCGLLACSFDDTSGGGGGEASSTSNSTTEGTTSGGSVDPSGAEGTRGGSSGTPMASTSSGDTTGGTGTPAGDGCCEAHEGPGCNEAAVQQCVCEAEQECCLFGWTESCAELAQTRCDATCESDDSGSTGGGSSDSGRVGCEESVVIELAPAEAVLSGNWSLGVSDLGEGEILRLQGGVQGEARFDVDVPCDDTWFVWVRYWEDGEDDSYFVTLDEAPEPPAVFEGDCTPAGSGYAWRLLNYRDPKSGSLCEYVEDPWAPAWDAGPHAIAFSFREAIALGRLVVTNDPRFAP